MEELAARLVDPLVGVRAEIIALGLEQVRRQARAAILIVKAERGANAGTGMPFLAATATTLRQDVAIP